LGREPRVDGGRGAERLGFGAQEMRALLSQCTSSRTPGRISSSSSTVIDGSRTFATPIGALLYLQLVATGSDLV